MLGLTDVPDDTLIRWFRGFAAYLVDFGRSSEVAEHGRAIKAELAAYLDTRLEPLAANPDGSTLSHLLHDGMPTGTTRSIDAIIGDIGVMIVGGFQEPAHGAANSLHGLFTRPEQAARLRADPAAWSAAAVEEGLRWLAPFGMTEKLTTAGITLGGVRFPAGTEVALVLGSANRDEARYAEPDVFDLDRPRQGHASFGYGVHFCLGHFAARQLEQVMLEEMFARLPNLRPDPGQEADRARLGGTGSQAAARRLGSLTAPPIPRVTSVARPERCGRPGRAAVLAPGLARRARRRAGR